MNNLTYTWRCPPQRTLSSARAWAPLEPVTVDICRGTFTVTLPEPTRRPVPRTRKSRPQFSYPSHGLPPATHGTAGPRGDKAILEVAGGGGATALNSCREASRNACTNASGRPAWSCPSGAPYQVASGGASLIKVSHEEEQGSRRRHRTTRGGLFVLSFPIRQPDFRCNTLPREIWAMELHNQVSRWTGRGPMLFAEASLTRVRALCKAWFSRSNVCTLSLRVVPTVATLLPFATERYPETLALTLFLPLLRSSRSPLRIPPAERAFSSGSVLTSGARDFSCWPVVSSVRAAAAQYGFPGSKSDAVDL